MKEFSENDGSGNVNFINTEDLKRDVAINPHDLDNVMITHPVLLVHYSVQCVKAKFLFEAMKNKLDILEAKLDSYYRVKLAETGKKPTEVAIRNAIMANDNYVKMQKKVLSAQEEWRYCEIAEEAFSQRKDLILEIARDRRKEKDSQNRVFESHELRQEVLSR